MTECSRLQDQSAMLITTTATTTYNNCAKLYIHICCQVSSFKRLIYRRRGRVAVKTNDHSFCLEVSGGSVQRVLVITVMLTVVIHSGTDDASTIVAVVGYCNLTLFGATFSWRASQLEAWG